MRVLTLGSIWLIVLWLGAELSTAQSQDLSDEERQQVLAAERFLKVLEKSPRRGTALDRVYGHHVEFGSLDAFVQQLKDRVGKDAKDDEAWMLLGLFESQRGADAAAVEAFRQADSLRPEDALAPYYLGQSLLRLGKNTEAVAAFEQSLARKPARNDLLEIFQQLGRVHQRAQRTDEALKVWQRLESLFPNDPRVLEQISVTLNEEGAFADALPRYEKLIELTTDAYRKVLFRVDAAGLKVKTNRRDAGIADLEAVLTDLNPTSWLYRDVRRRIEDVFLKSNDQDSLVKYYENRLVNHPEDIDAMSRLAKFLASSARMTEAASWMEKALKLAPSRAELRKAFIDQLVDDQRYPEALRQYEQLVANAPSNPDYLRDWGKLVMKDKTQDIDARKKEAARIWNQIVALRPDDASNLAQVADFCRQAGLNDEAVALYRQAVDKAPDDPQYREYLGEFYHILKRPDEALTIWKSIADGSRRTPANLQRLAEVYASFGLATQAIVEIAEACRLSPKDFALHIQAAEYHARAEKPDEALTLLATAEKLAATDDERETVVKQRIEIFQSRRRLESEIKLLAAAIQSTPAPTAEQWHRLARYQEAERQWSAAMESIEAALQIDPKSLPVQTTAARIAESSGDFGQAAERNRILAALDRRSLGDYLMNVARLEMQLGRTEEALKAAQELIVSAPGNTDNYEFLAQTCFRLGKQAEGLEALRKAVRINPNEPSLIMALGTALADQMRIDEAVEVYWRAFEKSDNVEDKTSLTLKLVPLYIQLNQFDKLLERFERDRREEDKRREMTICLAQAHNAAGDYATARNELESLLSQDTRDTNLLQQLAKLCEGAFDQQAAIGYQRQLVAIAPGAETELPLAKMLQTRGDQEEATDIYVRLTQREEDPVRLLKSLDSLLTASGAEAVLKIIEPILAQRRDDWELVYREGVAWSLLNKPDEARLRFRRLLAINVPHDSLGASSEAQFKQEQAKAKSDNLRGGTPRQPTKMSPLDMMSYAYTVQRAVGLVLDNTYYGSSGPPPMWMPTAFGTARMAAYGWLLRFEDESPEEGDADSAAKPNALLTQVQLQADNPQASPEALYDALYVMALKNLRRETFAIARRLAQIGGVKEKQFFLNAIPLRDLPSDGTPAVVPGQPSSPQRTPLSESDLELMIRCYEATAATKAEDSGIPVGGQILVSGGRTYINVNGRYIALSSVANSNLLGTLIDELKLAGRDEQAQAFMDKHTSDLSTTAKAAAAMQLFFDKQKFDELPRCYRAWLDAAANERSKTTNAATGRSTSVGFPTQGLSSISSLLVRWMGKLGADEENAELLKILDPALDSAIAAVKQTRTTSVNRPTTSSSSSSLSQGRAYYELYYGSESIQANVDFPPPNPYIDSTSVMLLREVYEVYQRNGVVEDFVKHLRERVDKTQPENRIYDQIFLAALLWWSDEKDEAATLLVEASNSIKEDADFRFTLAAMRESQGEFDDALEIVESIMPRDQKLVQRKELQVLRLAERVGERDRAVAAAERLFGLRLDTNSQIELVGAMRRLGLDDLAEAVTARITRLSGNQSNTAPQLIAMFQSKGKTSEANQTALSILLRTSNPRSALASHGRNPFRYSSSNDNGRRQALQVLKQTGELKKLIAKTETLIERSPNSIRLHDQLIEYCEADGDRPALGKAAERAVKVRPDSPIFRYQLAKYYESNNINRACDQYLELLKLKPNWILEDLSNVRNTFKRSNRTAYLIEAVNGMNLKNISSPYYIVDLIGEVLRDPNASELAITLFEKVYDAHPSYRTQMFARLSGSQALNNDRLYELAKKALIPSAAAISQQPWHGVHQIYSYSSNGTVSGHTTEIIRNLSNTPKHEDLRKSIEAAVKDNQGWLGGKAFLALLDIRSSRKTEGMEALEKLVADEKILRSMPADACWLIGQELDESERTRRLAVKLFERAVGSNSSRSMMQQIEYSPIGRLIKAYDDLGREDEARDALLKVLRTVEYSGFDRSYASSQNIQNKVWAAKKLEELNAPVDAVRLYREVMNDSTGSTYAAQQRGMSADHYIELARTRISKIVESITGQLSAPIIARLLDVPEKIPSGQQAIDLMLNTPTIETIHKKSLESGFLELAPNVASEIDARLVELKEKHPNDLSVRIALAGARLRRHHPQASESVKDLAQFVESHPLDVVPEGRRPNSRQRKAAAASVPLWLIAKDCFVIPELKSEAQVLAQQALEGARRQLDNRDTMAILFDWSKLLAAEGNQADSQGKLEELLTFATVRVDRSRSTPPGVRANGAAPSLPANLPPEALSRLPPELLARLQKTGAQQEASIGKNTATPPLTLSQFKMTMAVAEMAADVDMPELSRKAVRQALLGGMPIDDEKAKTGETTSSGLVYRSPQTGLVTFENANPLESQVATSLQKVIDKWQGDAYPAEEIYNSFKAVVLPADRPKEIFFYADSTQLRDAKVKSLAGLMVDWAKKAGKLAELDQAVNERMKNERIKFNATVLSAMIANAAGDTAKTKAILNEIAERLTKSPTVGMFQLACHAALPATDNDETKVPAFAVLAAAVQSQIKDTNPNAGSNSPEAALGALAQKVNRYMASTGDEEAVKKHFDSLITANLPFYSRYGGDYGAYKHAQDTISFAGEAARLEMPTVALNLMGQAVDIKYSQHSPVRMDIPLGVVCRHLNGRPANERYETWFAWTMPTVGRQSVRLVCETSNHCPVPLAFIAKNKSAAGPLTSRLLCNWLELISAAREVNRLPELEAAAKRASEANLSNADALLTLVYIEAGNIEAAEPLIKKLVADLQLRKQPAESATVNRNETFHANYLLFRACRGSSKFTSIYDQALGRSIPKPEELEIAGYASPVFVDYAQRILQDHGATTKVGADPGFVHWFPASTLSSTQPAVDPWWVPFSDGIAHLAGAANDALYFRYPLVGEFEFTAEGYRGNTANADIGFGGSVFQRHLASVISLSGRETVQYPTAAFRVADGFQSLKITSDGKQQTVYHDGHRVYSEPISETSPWLTLFSQGSNVTSFRNLKFSGKPSIPDEVKLIAGDSMDGWNCSFGNESRPRVRLMAAPSSGSTDPNATEKRNEPAKFDWNVKDGVLRADSTAEAATPSQSWIYYHRPLQTDETFRYEFYYEAGKSVAQPTIGRVALLLEPEAIKSHWIASIQWDGAVYGVGPDSTIIESEFRRGPSSLPLRDNDWNSIETTRQRNSITVTLNGTPIYEKPIEVDSDTRFGFFRYKHQQTQVRNATLRGDWLKALGGANLLATTTKLAPAERLALHAIVGDKMFIDDASQIVARVSKLPNEVAFQLLQSWVLPSDDHRSIRLHYNSTPHGLDNAPVESSAEAELISPAFELAKLAKKLDRLPDLIRQIEALESSGAVEQRNQSAMLVLCAIEAGDESIAKRELTKLYKTLVKGLPKELAIHERSAEYLVAWRAASDPKYVVDAADIANALVKIERDKALASGLLDWRNRLGVLSGKIAAASCKTQGDASKADELTQWHRVPYIKRNDRIDGRRTSYWQFERGALQHIPGGAAEQLFFQSPLQGKFEIVAQRSMFENRDVGIAYGMHCVDVLRQKPAISVIRLMQAAREIEKKTGINGPSDIYHFRLVVDDSTVTTFVDGQQIHQEAFTASPDPWVVLQAKQPNFFAAVRDLRIVGTPTIPVEIDLIETAGWAGWRADLYNESHAGSRDMPKQTKQAPASSTANRPSGNEPWQRIDDELVGLIRKNLREPRESLLMYQRPILEDGELEWESYYEAGVTEAHPAIGRYAFMVRPDGVKLLRLTGSESEVGETVPHSSSDQAAKPELTTSPTADNESPIEGSKPATLKEKKWNRFRLKIIGSHMTLTVNDQAVANYKLDEVPAERWFGIFHYADKTNSRVRKLIYRGHWPKTLPAVEDQETAYPPKGPYRIEASTTLDLTLNQSLETLQKSGLVLSGPADRIATSDQGLVLTASHSSSEPEASAKNPSVKLTLPLVGNAEATIDFSDLKTNSAKQGFGVVFSLTAEIDDGHSTTVECAAKTLIDGQKIFNAAVRRQASDGSFVLPDSIQLPRSLEAGRLRIVRKGGELHCLVAEPDSEAFTLLQSFPIGGHTIKSITIEPRSSDEIGQAVVTVKRLVIRTPSR